MFAFIIWQRLLLETHYFAIDIILCENLPVSTFFPAQQPNSLNLILFIHSSCILSCKRAIQIDFAYRDITLFFVFC